MELPLVRVFVLLNLFSEVLFGRTEKRSGFENGLHRTPFGTGK